MMIEVVSYSTIEEILIHKWQSLYSSLFRCKVGDQPTPPPPPRGHTIIYLTVLLPGWTWPTTCYNHETSLGFGDKRGPAHGPVCQRNGASSLQALLFTTCSTSSLGIRLEVAFRHLGFLLTRPVSPERLITLKYEPWERKRRCNWADIIPIAVHFFR